MRTRTRTLTLAEDEIVNYMSGSLDMIVSKNEDGTFNVDDDIMTLSEMMDTIMLGLIDYVKDV